MSLSQTKISPTPKTASTRHRRVDVFVCESEKKTTKRKKTKRPPGDGLPDKMTTEQLRSPTAVADLYAKYRGQLCEQDFFGLAVRAVRKGDNPPAAFRWMLANNAAHQITVAEDREAVRMRRQVSQQRDYLPEVKAVVAHLRSDIRWRPLTDQEVNARRNAVLDQLERMIAEERR